MWVLGCVFVSDCVSGPAGVRVCGLVYVANSGLYVCMSVCWVYVACECMCSSVLCVSCLVQCN